MEQLPLRIPPDLIDHVEEHRRSLIRTRRRADKELHVDFNDSLASTNGTGNPSQQLKRYCCKKSYNFPHHQALLLKIIELTEK